MKKEMIALIALLLLISCATPEPVQIEEELEMPQEEIIPDEPVQEVPAMTGCTDSDGGLNEFVKGTTQNSKDTVEDSCLFVKTNGRVPIPRLAEYFCVQNDIVAEIVKCEHGCENGACLREPKSELPVHNLIEEGTCQEGSIIQDSIKITTCYNDCLSQTACQPAPLETTAIKLPAQLNCLVRTDQWVVEKWVEFEVLKPVDVKFVTEVEGSEVVLVEVWDSAGRLLAAPINSRSISNNYCFAEGYGAASASLQPGQYEVRIGAKATGPDLLRSFWGKNFGVSFV